MKATSPPARRRRRVEFRTLSESETQLSLFGVDDTQQETQKRNPTSGIAHMMQQLMPIAPQIVPRQTGVGARHGSSPSPSQGGRYQNICDVFEIRPPTKKYADPRLDELAAMGMQEYWLSVAEYLGADAFLGMWRILDSNEQKIPKSKGASSMSLVLRPYSNYTRFQKNRFVESLAAQGIPPREIQRRVKDQLCENISMVNIWRLSGKNKIKS